MSWCDWLSPVELVPQVATCLAQQTHRLPLSGVDPKAASDQESGELQLSAVYTALLTRRLETDEDGLLEISQLSRR